jgi:hypothetical protein
MNQKLCLVLSGAGETILTIVSDNLGVNLLTELIKPYTIGEIAFKGKTCQAFVLSLPCRLTGNFYSK